MLTNYMPVSVKILLFNFILRSLLLMDFLCLECFSNYVFLFFCFNIYKCGNNSFSLFLLKLLCFSFFGELFYLYEFVCRE